MNILPNFWFGGSFDGGVTMFLPHRTQLTFSKQKEHNSERICIFAFNVLLLN
ncbi:hypothetical protein VIBNISFn27_940093 [Vibrio nigripulchritudo SFn27]|nr:hypothetical protein VIBNISFn27_940093 [Vibrio nigripulchritudo SFn27]